MDSLHSPAPIQELEFQTKKREKVHGDKFVDVMGSFVKVAHFSLAELDESWKEMNLRVGCLLSMFSMLQLELNAKLGCYIASGS